MAQAIIHVLACFKAIPVPLKLNKPWHRSNDLMPGSPIFIPLASPHYHPSSYFIILIIIFVLFQPFLCQYMLIWIILITYFSTVVPLTSFVVNAVFSSGLVVPSVSWLGQLTVGVQSTDYFNCWVSKFLLWLGLGFWSWSSNHWWGEKFVYWVILSFDDIIEQVFGGGRF